MGKCLSWREGWIPKVAPLDGRKGSGSEHPAHSIKVKILSLSAASRAPFENRERCGSLSCNRARTNKSKMRQPPPTLLLMPERSKAGPPAASTMIAQVMGCAQGQMSQWACGKVRDQRISSQNLELNGKRPCALVFPPIPRRLGPFRAVLYVLLLTAFRTAWDNLPQMAVGACEARAPLTVH